jgi:tetratricopeptide (TPR) repeat protein
VLPWTAWAVATCIAFAMQGPGVFAMNAASIAAAKAGLDQSWALRWAWSDAGVLDVGAPPVDAAVRVYEEARERSVLANPSGPKRPWELLAAVKRDESSGRHDAAVEALRHGFDSEYLIPIASRQLDSGDLANARRVVELAYAAAPDSFAIAALLGHILVLEANPASSGKALLALERAAARQPDDPAVQCDYAHALINAGRYSDALPHLARAEARQPNDPTIHLMRGDVLQRHVEVLRNVEKGLGLAVVRVRQLPRLELDRLRLTVDDKRDLRHYKSLTFLPESAA